MSTTPPTALRELASRRGDGLEITLLWHPGTDRVTVSVADLRSGTGFDIDVPPAEALSAFHHPFGHLAARDALPAAMGAGSHDLQPQG